MTNKEIIEEMKKQKLLLLKYIKESFKEHLTEYEAKDVRFFLGKIMRKTTGQFNPTYGENL